MMAAQSVTFLQGGGSVNLEPTEWLGKPHTRREMEKEIQLTPEQHGFELHGSTYTQIFLSS